MGNYNKPVPKGDQPKWMQMLSPEEREKYLHSSTCTICNATHNGRLIRPEIEMMVIERKKYQDICDIMFNKYNVRILPSQVSTHMSRHAPNYAEAVTKILTEELESILEGGLTALVTKEQLLMTAIQLSLHNMLVNPDGVSPEVGIRAATELHKMTEGMELRVKHEISQQDINSILDVVQEILSPSQKELLYRKLYGDDIIEGDVEEASFIEEDVIVVDGEVIELDKIHFMEEDTNGQSLDTE